MNPRVIVTGNSGDGFSFRIEDVVPEDRHNRHRDAYGTILAPFVRWEGGLLSAPSIADLKSRLRLMLKACDAPALYLTDPELKEWGK